jgi:hypothetical protein
MSLLLGTTPDCRSCAPWLRRRLAALMLPVALSAAFACGGDDDSGTTVTGQYDLTQVDGQDLPTSGEELGSEFTFIEFEETTEVYNDEGSYTAEDGDIEFTSTTFGDDFSGTVDDGTLEINYDFDGEAGAESQLNFE